jgi:hypothetical protein
MRYLYCITTIQTVQILLQKRFGSCWVDDKPRSPRDAAAHNRLCGVPGYLALKHLAEAVSLHYFETLVRQISVRCSNLQGVRSTRPRSD